MYLNVIFEKDKIKFGTTEGYGEEASSYIIEKNKDGSVILFYL